MKPIDRIMELADEYAAFGDCGVRENMRTAILAMAAQPQPKQRTADCTLCGHCAATGEKLPIDDTALLRQALAALEVYGAQSPDVNQTIAALRVRLA